MAGAALAALPFKFAPGDGARLPTDNTRSQCIPSKR